MRAIQVLVEIEQTEEIIFSLERSELLVQPDEISGGAVPFFLDKTDVIFLLKFEHLVLAVPQVLLHGDKLLADRGGNVVALVLAHPFLEIEILLHDGVEVGLSVLGGAADSGQVKNRSARLLHDRNLDRNRLHFRVGGADKRLGAATHLRALHELDLGAVKVNAVFAVDRVLADVQFTGEHHLARGKEFRRRLVNQPGLHKKAEANRQDRNPPAPQEQRFVAMDSREYRRAPGGRGGTIRSNSLHKITC